MKLTKEDKRDIVDYFTLNFSTYATIAEKFNVSAEAIRVTIKKLVPEEKIESVFANRRKLKYKKNRNLMREKYQNEPAFRKKMIENAKNRYKRVKKTSK